MVAAVRRGISMRAVARRFHVSLAVVQWWVRRARGQRLDRVDWGDRSRRPHRTRRTPRRVEDRVLALRRQLRDESVLGEYGAPAIARALEAREGSPPLSVRTIGRILERRGAVDHQHRVRHAPPPAGWYLPAVARATAELDSFDVIEGLKIADGPRLEVLTGISLHGGLAAAWPMPWVSARAVVPTLLGHWHEVGLPTYAQFDNDTIFQGPHQHRDAISRVMRLCLGLGVVPVFAPPREPGFQAAIESFNARWQAKVWARFHHATLRAVQQRSVRYIKAHREQAAVRLDAAPLRREVPPHWEVDLQQRPTGTMVFLRRTGPQGAISLLGHTMLVDRHWPHRLVRADVDLASEEIRLHALRRRAPSEQPLLRSIPYTLPIRPFNE